MAVASPRSDAARVVRVIFLGPPGAGKGTQAAKLAAHLGVPRISTGDMLRDAIAKGTAIGREAQPVMERGVLVPDQLLIALVAERIGREDCDRGFVLDGFPRTVPQARGLEEMASGDAEWTVFDFQVPRPELMRRLSGRRWCPRCQATYHLANDPPRREGICDCDGASLVQREDDREAVVARRLQEYDERTAPLRDHYARRVRLVNVDGHRTVGEVFRTLLDGVEARA